MFSHAFQLRFIVVACSLWSLSALAQVNTGVSDERVTLPQAPGSVSGVGENASVEGNQGAMQYSVAIDVPPGFAGLTPTIALSYSSSQGASLTGMGWAMPGYAIERMTSRGLQKYDLSDRFVVDGSQELVRVAETGSSATYRARFEGGFVRYTWVGRGTGEGGWWKAEFPDGRVGYYGADTQGAEVASSMVRVPTSSKTFAWHLVVMQDPWGHQMKLNWTKDGTGYPLLERIDYLFEGSLARHSVRFTYETRPDILSDARPGFELRLTQRLKEVRVYSGTVTPDQLRRYALTYEPVATSGGASRLASVARFGRGDVQFPVKFSFGYSKTLGGACTTNCDKPFVVNMGVVPGVDFNAGNAVMVDMNGDAIPDVVFSDAQGRHQFIYGKLDSEGKASFSSAPVPSTKTTGSSPFVIGDAKVQLLDVNGDGFVDLTQSKLPAVLCNNGSGDWVDASYCTASALGLPSTYTPEEDLTDAVQQDPKYVRFFDYDNDKRIDWLRTFAGGSGTEVLANTPSGFNAVTVDNIGAVFDESPLQLADMNGDGLQDPVQVLVSGASVTVQYKLNLGFGHWSVDWKVITVSGLTATQAGSLDVQDLNGDGLADLVSVAGNEVAIVLNVNGDSFQAPLTITSADLGGGSIPSKGPGVLVSYADMNGNGSDDIVWLQADHPAQYLELFPVRPNLISRIDNGIGAVQLVRYGTSIAEQARDVTGGKPWANRVPNATVVVTRVDSYVTLTGTESGGLHEVVVYRYHSGYYDGAEKQFRGYEGVERELQSDLSKDAQEPTLIVLDFDVGRTDPAFAGRTRKRQVFSLAASTPSLVSEQRHLDQLCTVAEVPSTVSPAVAWACERATTTIVVERDLANARTLQVQREYDGYGNVSRQLDLGVLNLGTPESPKACGACVASGLFGQPCGEQCVGDEQAVQTTYVVPGAATGDRWMLNRPQRVASGAVSTSLNVETRTFYDGPEFTGLEAGKLTLGGVTRVARHVGPGANDFIDVSRVKRDAAGNVVELIEPNGTLAGTGERRTYTYDSAGLWTTQAVVTFADGHSVRRDLVYDTAFEEPSQASNWYAVVGGQPVTPPQQTRWRYDEHGRVSKKLDPGDAEATPSTEYQYELADPASRVLTLKRSAEAQAADLVTAECFDGRGRLVQRRSRLSDTSWQVSGFTEFDQRGAPVRVYQPYLAATGACDVAPPSQVPFKRTSYDVLGRQLKQVDADGATTRYEYGPLLRRFFDEEASEPASPSANTPVIEETDGLGRLVRLERTLPGGAPSAITTLNYDADGNLLTVKDPSTLPHTQHFDAMGRLLDVSDPNSGTQSRVYDAAGNITQQTDASGKVTKSTWDALKRPLTRVDPTAETASKVTWTWDLTTGCSECTHTGGRLAQIEWSANGQPARERFGYDPRGNVIFHEKSLGGHTVALHYRYDRADRRTTTLYPAGLTVSNTFDGASRVSAIAGVVTSAEYTERDQVKAIAFANGAHSAYDYDNRLQLSALRTTAADGSALLDLGYARDRTGEITVITDRSARAQRARHGAAFTYDPWNRLTHAEFERNDAEKEVLSYAFDTSDRITSLTSNVAGSRAQMGTYTYDTQHVDAVTSAGGLTYSYDASGRLATRGNTDFSYDHLGRLVSATREGQSAASFAYGPGPDRLTRQEGAFTTWYVTDGFELRDGIAVVYVELGGRRVARLESDAAAASVLSDLAPATGSGTLTPKGNNTIDIADAWLAQAAKAGVVSFATGTTPSDVSSLLASAARRLLVQNAVWLHEDALQSIVAATDAKGLLLGERAYYPTGAERSSTGFVDVRGFTGQELDQSTGLVHFGYRELDPAVGRWTSVDPTFTELTPTSVRQLGQATAAYAYGGNDFTNTVDPTGLLFGRVKSIVSKAIRHFSPRGRSENGNGNHHAQQQPARVANNSENRTTQYHPIPAREVFMARPTGSSSPYQPFVRGGQHGHQYARIPHELLSAHANQYANIPKGLRSDSHSSEYANIPHELLSPHANEYANIPTFEQSPHANEYANIPRDFDLSGNNEYANFPAELLNHEYANFPANFVQANEYANIPHELMHVVQQ